ncbi:MAG: MBL fold metallo-hydrolase [Wujia sp.]
MANIITITNVLGSMATNCYTVANTETREAIIVDPAARADYLINMYANQKLKPIAVLLTHGHFDHIGALEQIKKQYPDIQVYIGKDEEDVLRRPELNLSEMFGISISSSADKLMEDGDTISLLGTNIKCIHVPGHTKGGMCYYFPEEKLLFSGDTLFCSSIGRSDFPTGDGQALIENIEKKLLTLPEDVTVYPGHDSRTNIKREKEQNPYF